MILRKYKEVLGERRILIYIYNYVIRRREETITLSKKITCVGGQNLIKKITLLKFEETALLLLKIASYHHYVEHYLEIKKIDDNNDDNNDKTRVVMIRRERKMNDVKRSIQRKNYECHRRCPVARENRCKIDF